MTLNFYKYCATSAQTCTFYKWPGHLQFTISIKQHPMSYVLLNNRMILYSFAQKERAAIGTQLLRFKAQPHPATRSGWQAVVVGCKYGEVPGGVEKERTAGVCSAGPLQPSYSAPALHTILGRCSHDITDPNTLKTSLNCQRIEQARPKPSFSQLISLLTSSP